MIMDSLEILLNCEQLCYKNQELILSLKISHIAIYQANNYKSNLSFLGQPTTASCLNHNWSYITPKDMKEDILES